MTDDAYEDGSPTSYLTRVRDHFAPQPIHRNERGDAVAFFGVTDFTTPVFAHVVEDMATAICAVCPFFQEADLIVSIADRSSGALTHAVAKRTKIPYTLANWYPDGSPGEQVVDTCAGFSGSGLIYLNGVTRGRRAVLVMDVLKTGGTASKLVAAAQQAGAVVVGAVFSCEILEAGGRQRLGDTKVQSLVQVHLRGEMTKEGGDGPLLPATRFPPPAMPSRVRELKLLHHDEVRSKMERVAKGFVGIPIQRNPTLNYPYSFFQLTDFVPAMDADVVEEMADLCVHFGDFSKCDLIVSEADRGGGPLVQAVAVRTGLPYVLANWYPSGEGVGAASDAQVGFSGQGRIVVNGVSVGARCVFVDDMLSSGGTAEGVVKSLVQLGGIPMEGVFISEKLYPPKHPNELPIRKGLNRLQAIFPSFKVTTVVQFIADGDTTTAPANRVGDY